jgi:hypothetical protein
MNMMTTNKEYSKLSPRQLYHEVKKLSRYMKSKSVKKNIPSTYDSHERETLSRVGEVVGAGRECLRKLIYIFEDENVPIEVQKQLDNNSITLHTAYHLAIGKGVVKSEKTHNLIYFLFDPLSKRVKIGTAHEYNLQIRIETIAKFSPVDLNLIGIIKGNKTTEAELHKKLEEHRHHSEWFNCNLYTERFIQDLLSRCGLSFHVTLGIDDNSRKIIVVT